MSIILSATVLLLFYLIVKGFGYLDYMIWVYTGGTYPVDWKLCLVVFTIVTGFLAYCALPIFLYRDRKKKNGSLLISMIILAISAAISFVLFKTKLVKGFPPRDYYFLTKDWPPKRFMIHPWSLVMFSPKPLFYFKIAKKVSTKLNASKHSGINSVSKMKQRIDEISSIYRNGGE